MDAHEYYLITTLKAAWEEGKKDGRAQRQQQVQVDTEMKEQRAAMKRRR